MESMAEASSLIGGFLYGIPAGLIVGVVIAVVCRDFRVRAIHVGVFTTVAAIVGTLAIHGVLTYINEKLDITYSTYLKLLLWYSFVPAMLTVVVIIQWFVWLLEQVALIYWRRKNADSSLQ